MVKKYEMNTNRLSKLIKKSDIKFFTGSYLDLDIIKNKEILFISISGGNLLKELKNAYGDKKGEEIFSKISFQEERLAPSWNIYKKYRDSNDDKSLKEYEYYQEFKEKILGSVDLISVVENILEKAIEWKKNKILFLCYESSEEFCHRHIVAEHFQSMLEIEMPEFSNNKTERTLGKLLQKL